MKEKIKNFLRKIAEPLVTGIVVGVIVGTFYTCLYTSRIKGYSNTIKAQTAQIDSLQRKCEELGNMDCITVNTTFEINNKNILSVNTTQANNISRTYATYTKNEVLAALDSLDKIK